MSDNTLTVRDHSKPCEHVERMIPTYRDAFGIDYLEGATIRCPWDGSCPGGREIVLETLMVEAIRYPGGEVEVFANPRRIQIEAEHE